MSPSYQINLDFLPSTFYQNMQQSRNPSEDPRVSELLNLLKQLIPSSPTLGLHDSDYLKSYDTSLNSSKTVCDTVLIDIIKKNNFDQDRCIDAALIFYDSLTSNERIAQNEKSQYSPVANQLQTQILSGDSNFGYNKPTSKVPSSSISYGKVLAVEPPPQKVKPRGSHWTLPETFLRAPRFRYFVTIESNFAIFFTVIYRRTAHADRMGLSIGNVEWESVVLNLHSKGPYDPFPAKESGVEVGDVLLGIDSEYFCPAAEVPDIIEMLNLLWQKRNSFVSLHFMRLKSYLPYVEQNKTKILNEKDLLNQYVPIHPAIKYLTDQGVIDRKQVRCVDTYLQRMKDRAINWDTQAVADRMGKWNLDVNFKDIDSNSLLKLPNFLWDKSSTGNSLSLSGQSKRKGPALGDTDSDSNNALNAHLRKGSFLRPAISVTLLKADEQVDCVMYILRVIDIRSGVDWVVRRRFREFFELREQLISVRPSVESIEFPVKRLNVIENHVVVGERMKLLQIFLRRLTGIVCVNTLHPSTSRMLLIFQRFLSTEAQMESILHQEGNFEVLPVRMAQVFIHSILQMSVMDKVLCGFIESFIQDRDVDGSNREWTDSDGVAALEEMRKFLDHLQGFIIDCFHTDCAEIVTHFTQKSRRISACSVQMLSNMASDSPSSSSSPYPSPFQRHREKVSTTANTDMIMKASDSEVMKFISEDELRSVISSAVRKQIEIEVYLPCSSRLTSLLDKAYFKREKNVRHIISCIVNQPQSFYGIPVDQISPSSWESIVSNLKEIRSKSLPFERIDCLLSVAKEIPTVYRFEHPDLSRQQEPDQQQQQQPQPQQQCLGADDILPVFIYILVRAQIPNLLALNQELQTLCDSERRMSEAGYYLATLEASIQHISEANVDKVFNNAARYGGSRSSSVDRDSQLFNFSFKS